MSTVNISLPKEQLNFIDKLVNRYSFANRSEFIRAVLRLVAFRPEVLNQTITFPFLPPSEKSVSKIMAGFEKTKKYNKAFLKDLEEGLNSSNFFTK